MSRSLGQIGQQFHGKPSGSADGKAPVIPTYDVPPLKVPDTAPCRKAGPRGADELWFGGQREQAIAAERCHACTIETQCGAWALATGQDSGCWGGLTEEQRRALRKGAA